MKIFISFHILFWGLGIIHAQQASDYFPHQPGWKWEYNVTPLDSLNNEITILKYFRHELFLGEGNFEGKSAKIVTTKYGPAETINIQPYLDTLFYSFSGSNGYEYFKPDVIENLITLLSSAINDSTFSVLSFFQSLEKWYSVYRFAQNTGDEYTIFQIDTTVTINSQILLLRLEFIGERLPDESIGTVIGNLDCKKFVKKIRLSYLIIIPPLPPIAIPILSLKDYVWIAEDYWIVKSMMPSTNVDLSFLGIDPFFIPGLSTNLDGITDVEDEIGIPTEISLKQNYPNPFNSSTKISWQSPVGNWQTIKVYDVLGNEVATLVDEYKLAGSYEIEWNAVGLPSGVYFYQLKTNKYTKTKKMILMK